MSTKNCYIFRSGELFLSESNELPTQIPAEFFGAILDSLELVLSGRMCTAVLLTENKSSSSVVNTSVSDASVAAIQLVTPGTWIKLRTIIASPEPEVALLGPSATRALGLLNWHNSHRFCSRCGGEYLDHPKQVARVCSRCSKIVFPRLSPAIIVLVQKEGKILLARHVDRNQDVFSCIAGYVEHGESLEECVVREVAEETGLRVHNVRYAGSQSWPFPDQYMVAFYADWESGDICVDPGELLEAKWFDRDNLPNHPMAGTVAWRLINGF